MDRVLDGEAAFRYEVTASRSTGLPDALLEPACQLRWVTRVPADAQLGTVADAGTVPQPGAPVHRRTGAPNPYGLPPPRRKALSPR